MKHSAAIGAPTRLSISRRTSTERSLSPAKAVTRSPMRTGVAALAALRLTRTCPPRHASVASDRVLYSRIAQSHLSTRVTSTPRSLHGARARPLEVVGDGVSGLVEAYGASARNAQPSDETEALVLDA
jgi:hypothetical protein